MTLFKLLLLVLFVSLPTGCATAKCKWHEDRWKCSTWGNVKAKCSGEECEVDGKITDFGKGFITIGAMS